MTQKGNYMKHQSKRKSILLILLLSSALLFSEGGLAANSFLYADEPAAESAGETPQEEPDSPKENPEEGDSREEAPEQEQEQKQEQEPEAKSGEEGQGESGTKENQEPASDEEENAQSAEEASEIPPEAEKEDSTEEDMSIQNAQDKKPTVKLEYTPHKIQNKMVDYYDCTITATSNSGTPIKWIQFGRYRDPVPWTGGSTMKYEYRENGAMDFIVTDEAGYSDYQTIDVANVDWFPPEVESVNFVYDSVSVNGKTKSGHIQAEGAFDRQFGIADKPYSITDDWDLAVNFITRRSRDYSLIPPWNSHGKFDITQNGRYCVLLRDGADNISFHSIIVNQFDFDSPNAQVTGFAREENGFAAFEEIVVSASDSGAGLDAKAYSFDGGSSWQESNRLILSENRTVHIVVRDGLDNRTELEYEVTRNFDTAGPEVGEVREAAPDQYGDYIGGLIVDVRADDRDSKVSENGYSFDGGKTWQSSPVYEFKKNGTYIVKVRDNLGNETIAKEIVIKNLDDVPPVISDTQQELKETAGGYGKSKLITLRAHDVHSVISGNAYSFDGGTTWQASPEFTARRNGTLHVLVKDLFGNVSEKEITVNGIDDVPPEIHVSGLPEKNVTGAVTLTITGTDGESGLESLWYKNNTVNIPSSLKKFDRSLNGGGVGSGNAEASITVNGEYTFLAYDAVGNLSETTVTIDKISKKSSSSSSKKSKSSSSTGGSSPQDNERTIVLPPSSGGRNENTAAASRSVTAPEGNRETNGGTVHLSGALSDDSAPASVSSGTGGKSRESAGEELFSEETEDIPVEEDSDDLLLPEEEPLLLPDIQENLEEQTEEHEVEEHLSASPGRADELLASIQAEEQSTGMLGIVLTSVSLVLLLSGITIFILVKKGILSLEFLKSLGKPKES